MARPERDLPAPRHAPLPIMRRRALKRSEVIARDLASYIVDAELPAGTPLPPEHEMIDSLAVGRTTLREAMRLLETRGVLTIRAGPRGGPVVRRPNPCDLSGALTLILQFEGAALLQVIEARRAVEAAVTRLAATQITADDIAELRAINRTIADHADDQSEVLSGNAVFHQRIGEISGNVVLRVFLETLITIGDGRAVGVTYGHETVRSIVAAHEQIVAALESRDPAAAGAAMDAHLELSQRYWRRHFASEVNRAVQWLQ
jgi:GntR family transcriptional repressor for pyruvate dehydrogenase complex